MNKIGRIIVFVVALVITIYGLPQVISKSRFANLVSPFIDNNLTIKSPVGEITLVTKTTEWTEDYLLNKINDFRKENSLTGLKINTALSSAAKSRLAVITEFDDLTGETTGLTREKAVDSIGYKYSWIGDLNAINFPSEDDPIGYWSTVKNSKDTLLSSNLTEIGIAVKQTDNFVNAYILLATPQKKVAAKTQIVTPTTPNVTWGGPELWSAVNKRRSENGVGQLQKKDELCTIASIRLNQQIAKGTLDNHEGFVPTLDREDLKWISEKYNISEFLIYGYPTPEEAVKGWEATMGHSKLITGGEYVWGCVYAQDTYGVAIVAY